MAAVHKISLGGSVDDLRVHLKNSVDRGGGDVGSKVRKGKACRYSGNLVSRWGEVRGIAQPKARNGKEGTFYFKSCEHRGGRWWKETRSSAS